MAVARSKTRIQISLKDNQIAELEQCAQEMGLTKSDIISIATMQYISAYKMSKDITKNALSDALTNAIKAGDIDLERLKEVK